MSIIVDHIYQAALVRWVYATYVLSLAWCGKGQPPFRFALQNGRRMGREGRCERLLQGLPLAARRQGSPPVCRHDFSWPAGRGPLSAGMILLAELCKHVRICPRFWRAPFPFLRLTSLFLFGPAKSIVDVEVMRYFFAPMSTYQV